MTLIEFTKSDSINECLDTLLETDSIVSPVQQQIFLFLTLGLRSRLLAGEVAVRIDSYLFNKGLISARPACEGAFADEPVGFRIVRGCQPFGPVRDFRQKLSIRIQLRVIGTSTMCCRTRPAIVGGVFDHAGALRILLDIANRVAEM